ncbi:unnamed protein product, partial [Ectocarpus sp. 6 AP-2014]
WPSSYLLLLHPPSHHKSQLTPPEQLPPSFSPSVNKHASPKPPSLQRRYQHIVLHRRILSAGFFSDCFYPAARERSRLICECWLICCCRRRHRLARASPGRPRAAIPLPRHRLQHQPLFEGKYPQRQGRLPCLQELYRRHLRVDRPFDQVPRKGLLALRLRVRGRRSGVGIHHPRRGTPGVLHKLVPQRRRLHHPQGGGRPGQRQAVRRGQ